MKLIADSGSTKTDWVLTDGADVKERLLTQGINPFHQSEDDIRAILHSNRAPRTTQLEIHFYGSGVRPELKPLMERLLHEAFPKATAVEAHGDLLGAARAVCGHAEGIACILGTGANSGLYDGQRIWSWVVRLFPRDARTRLDSSGHAAWTTLTSFVRATVIVATVSPSGVSRVKE